MDLIETLHQSGLAGAIRNSLWLYPAVNALHVLGIALLFGAIVTADLRVLGRSPALPVSALLDHTLPLAWTGFGIAVLSGALLFSADARELVGNAVFLAKLGAVALAGANALAFHLLERSGRHAALPAVALLSLALWTLAIVLGRWIAYW